MVAGLAAVAAHRGDGHGCETGARLLGLREEGVEGISFGSGRECVGEHGLGPGPPGLLLGDRVDSGLWPMEVGAIVPSSEALP